jgi:protoporphyrinogen oxidase
MGVRPVVLEASGQAGGISATMRYKGNRIDIGGHRFFSKSDRVMDWWLSILPLQSGAGAVLQQLESVHGG